VGGVYNDSKAIRGFEVFTNTPYVYLDGNQKPALEQYGVDLTAKAREERLDPVIGRSGEIKRTIQILSRRTKNNPVLIGSAGTGKTAI